MQTIMSGTPIATIKALLNLVMLNLMYNMGRRYA